jgi:NADPH:quinone reductase-like Zn-dependent oxidoreductase
VPGWDVSGIVVAAGANVSRFAPGDAVFSRPDIRRDGTYAEYVALRASEAAAKPVTISHVEAASLPLVSITAWEALVTAAGIEPGQRVLIHAGSGGVGSIAVQLAKAMGAHVTSTTSSRNLALVESLGADRVIDYTAGPVSATEGPFDIVFDTIGGATQDASYDLLRPGGTLVSIISPPDKTKAAAAGIRTAFVFIDPNATVLDHIAALVDVGRIRPLIGAEFALADIAKAHELSETGRARGKIAIYVGQP